MTQRFLRCSAVQDRTGLSRSTLYLRMAQGRFPSPIPLGSPNAVGWLEIEIDQWINGQVQAARGGIESDPELVQQDE